MTSLSKLEGLIAKWRKSADTDYTTGQKLSDGRKQRQYELMMAGQSIAYATAAKELEAALKAANGDSATRSTAQSGLSPKAPEGKEQE